MTKKLFLSVIIASLVIIGGFLGCNKNNDITPKNEEIQKYIELKSKIGAFQSKDGIAFNAMNAIGRSMKAKSFNKDGRDDNDTTNWDWEDWTCAQVNEFINDEGYTVTVFDYGDEGCEEYGELTKGKITYIWKENGNEYYSKVIYESFYSYGMIMNGHSEYTYTDNGNYCEDYNDWSWSGTSTCDEDINMIFEDGEEFNYTAKYSDKWDENSYTVIEGNFSYKSTSEGYEYNYKVNKPLVYNFKCEEAFVPVSGVEEIYYKDEDGVFEFLIDYGEGTCDNKAMVTENGETYEIDFSDYWDNEDLRDSTNRR